MYKVMSRAFRAKSQAKKVLIRFNKKKEALRLKDGMRDEKQRLRTLLDEAKASRRELKEDRMLGPLAPRRAMSKEEIEQYGAISDSRMGIDYVPKDQRVRYWNIVVGDRVVILKGPDRHKIGIVKSVEKSRNNVVVEGMNMVPTSIPEPYRVPGNPNIVYRELPIKYSDVRLVHPLPDPETGILKDTIIAKVHMSKIWFNKRDKSKTWDRVIPGMEGVNIPWPVKNKKEPVDQLCDTKIKDVESKSFFPSLLKPPLPEGLIDELRNKYSKFRTRHDPEYVARKQAEHEERLAKQNARIMTPVQELNKKAREERKALGKPILSAEMLEKIGRVMAQNRPELLAAIQVVPVGEEALV